MSEALQRDRSPAFPVIPLKDALERLVQFETHFKRSSARPEKVMEAWDISAKGYADRIVAALRYFGLVDYQGQPGSRSVVVSEEGRKYLRAQQDEIKHEVIRAAALRPKQIAKFWADWGTDRPANAACLDELTMKNGFSDGGARDFLKVYDATITFAGLGEHDKVLPRVGEEKVEREEDRKATPLPPPLVNQHRQQVKIMEGERIAFTEEGQPGQYLKLIASGEVDDTMLEALEDFVKRQRKRLAILSTPMDKITKPVWADRTFRPNDFAPAVGVYDVTHYGHHPEGTTKEQQKFTKGQRFPECDECSDGDTTYKFAY
jgi:hypothetical protein